MMPLRIATVCAPLFIGMIYWEVVSRSTASPEPWDAPFYWTIWYPVSLLLSAVCGAMQRWRPWIAGAAITFAQLPVMAWHGEGGTMIVFGTVLLGLLSLPAAALAALASRLAFGKREI